MEDLESEEVQEKVLPTGKPHISYSELREWWDCSYRHKLRHVQKIDLSKPSIHLVFGTATHAVAEHFLKTKEIDLTKAEKTLDEGYEKHGTLEDFVKNPKEKLMSSVQNIMNELPKFLDEKFPGWVTVDAEELMYEDVKVLFEHHAGLKFKGYIDCIIKVPGKKEGQFLYWIIDFKTANRPWNREAMSDEKKRAQLVLYKKIWSNKHEIPIKDIRCGFITLLKTGKSGKLCALIPVSVGEVTITRVLKVLNNSLTSITKGVAIKNRNSCTYCDYKDTEHCK